MLRICTFSKDRPAQLRLLLESVEKHLPNTPILNTVIYKASNTEYQIGYDKVIREFQTVEFVPEENIYGQTLDIFLESVCPYGSFLCDDQIFYRTPSVCPLEAIADIEDSLGKSLCCFSMRLGSHTRMADYFTNTYQPALQTLQLLKLGKENLLVWPWNLYSPATDYGYPLSVSGHIYQMGFLVQMLSNMPKWNNPNLLEGVWQTLLSSTPPFIASYENSIVFNNPANRVSDMSGCPYAGNTQKEFNDKFLSGKVLDLQFYENQEIKGCHHYVGDSWVDG